MMWIDDATLAIAAWAAGFLLVIGFIVGWCLAGRFE